MKELKLTHKAWTRGDNEATRSQYDSIIFISRQWKVKRLRLFCAKRLYQLQKRIRG